MSSSFDSAPARSGSTPAERQDTDMTPAEHRDEDTLPDAVLAAEDGYIPDEDAPRAGPLANVGAAVVVIAFGAFGIISSLSLGIGSAAGPSAGTWPFAISVVITLLGITLLFTGRRLQDAEKFTRQSAAVIVGVVSLVGATFLLPVIGFEIPSFLLLLVWMKFLGGESWRLSIVIGALITAAFYAIFLLALRVPLPHLF